MAETDESAAAPRSMNFTQFAKSRGLPSDYDVLDHGRLGESGRMSRRLRKALSDQHLERARLNDQAHREFADAIRSGEIVDSEPLSSRRVTKQGLEESERRARTAEIQSKISGIESQIRNIEGLGTMSHLANGKLRAPYQRTVDLYLAQKRELEQQLNQTEANLAAE